MPAQNEILQFWGSLCLPKMRFSMMQWAVTSNCSGMVLLHVHAHQAKQGMAGAGAGQGKGQGRDKAGAGKGQGQRQLPCRARHNMKPQRTSQICADQAKACALPIGSNTTDSSNSITNSYSCNFKIF